MPALGKVRVKLHHKPVARVKGQRISAQPLKQLLPPLVSGGQNAVKNQIDVIRASASLPYVSRLVKTEGMKLLDGGCTDSIPLMKFREMGFTKNVVILTRPK